MKLGTRQGVTCLQHGLRGRKIIELKRMRAKAEEEIP